MQCSARVVRFFFPVLSGLLALVILGFSLAVGTGLLHLRRAPSSKYYVQRDEVAEKVLRDHSVCYVYRFGGGLVRCWAQIDSEGKAETIGPLNSAWLVGLKGVPVNPLPEQAEGYVAILGPAGKEKAFSMRGGVIHLVFPDGREPPTHVRMADSVPLLPTPAGDGKEIVEEPQGQDPSVGSFETAPTEWRGVQPGQDVQLLDRCEQVQPGKWVRVRLWLRFFSPEEMAAGVKE